MANTTTTSTSNLSLFAILDAVRRRKLLLIIPTVLVGAAFSYYALQQPDRYRAVTLIAAQQLTPPEYLRHVAPQPLHIEDHLWTVREVLFSDRILDEAARELSAYRNAQGQLSESALEEIKKDIAIKVDGEHTFTVGFEGDNAAEVANVTNKLASLFVSKASSQQEQKTEDTQSIIQQQLDDLKGRLSQEDARVRDYKQHAANELPEHVDDNIRAVDGLRANRQEVNSKIADDEARRTSIIKEMRELEAKGALEQPTVSEKTAAEAHLEDLRIKFDELRNRYKPNHPDVVKAQREIADLEKAIASQPRSARRDPSPTYLRYVSLQSELEGIEQRLKSYQGEAQSISSQIDGYQRRVEAAPRHERALDAMTREMTVGESQLHALLDKQLDARLAEGLENSESGVAFAIVEPASIPKEPFSPQRERLVLMGILAGLGLGIVMAFFMEQSDTTFGNVEDFQEFTSLPLAGVIPNVTGGKDSAGASRNAVITLTSPESVAAEQYRILAMKIQQQCAQSGAQVVLLTSAAGGEGKSLTAINLGLALTSIAGGPVLLVDADMRKPRLHEYLEVKVPPSRGFQCLIQNPESVLDDFTMRLGDLSVIPGGPAQPSSNPVATLASPKVRNLFDRLRTQYKLILVDAPPTLPIADSHMLSGLCDKVLFIVRARKTPRELFQHAVESFDASNLMGAVLNDVDYQRSRYAYAYEYYRENYLARK